MSYHDLVGHDVDTDYFTDAPTCAGCSAVLDAQWIGKVDSKVRDVSSSLDGATIVSRRFADFMSPISGVQCIPIDGSEDALLFVVDAVVEVDVGASGIERTDFCNRCDAWRGVGLTSALALRSLPPSPIARTDVCFGWGLGRSRPSLRTPVLLLDSDLTERVRAQNFTGATLLPVHVSVVA